MAFATPITRRGRGGPAAAHLAGGSPTCGGRPGMVGSRESPIGMVLLPLPRAGEGWGEGDPARFGARSVPLGRAATRRAHDPFNRQSPDAVRGALPASGEPRRRRRSPPRAAGSDHRSLSTRPTRTRPGRRSTASNRVVTPPPQRPTYLNPTRSNICCTFTVFAPTAASGIVSALKSPPPVIACNAGLLTFTPLAVGHSLLPLAK
jgi:hypothetical protein